MCRLNRRVRKQLTEVLHFLDSDKLLVSLQPRFYVRVSWAVLYLMTNLLATSAAHILVASLLVLGMICGLLFILVVILRLVSAILATRGLFAGLAAAPPHLATVVALMRAAAPIVIFFLVVLFATLFARLEPAVKLSLASNELLDSHLGFLFIHCQLLTGLRQIYNLLLGVIVFLATRSKLLVQFYLTLLRSRLFEVVLLLDLFLFPVKHLGVLPELVSILLQLGEVVLQFVQLYRLLLARPSQLFDLPGQLVAQLLVG